ncbi:hypothetical protein [Brevundimonas sp.]|uniref:hypothetical protein n=1 Tax=Brevundimonas sp. TaxID=1871086 RepID=UPI002628BC1F|nr:hypothetical protein [Brevundimonas sp.]
MVSRLPMRLICPALLALMLVAAPALAQAPATAPVPAAAEPLQFYVFSFTDTPVAEAAQDIVGGALAWDVTIDPAVDGLVTFRADGWYSSDALLRDFGSALLDQDIALMRTGPGAYAVVPRANVPMILARGGSLMTLAEPVTARPPLPAATVAAPTAVYGKDRWWDGAVTALLIFFGGALAGATALFGGQTVYRRAEERARIAAPLLRLTDQRRPASRPVEGAEADPDLVIPRVNEPRG